VGLACRGGEIHRELAESLEAFGVASVTLTVSRIQQRQWGICDDQEV
jgi:hypothetical protein